MKNHRKKVQESQPRGVQGRPAQRGTTPRTTPRLTKDFETDQNENLDQNVPRDPKQTIKSNDANNEFNVKSGIANYKCKVHCLKIPNLTLEFSS